MTLAALSSKVKFTYTRTILWALVISQKSLTTRFHNHVVSVSMAQSISNLLIFATHVLKDSFTTRTLKIVTTVQ